MPNSSAPSQASALAKPELIPGRIVYYSTTVRQNMRMRRQGVIARKWVPAIVTFVPPGTPDTVSLRMFPDGPATAQYTHVRDVPHGTKPGSWAWPHEITAAEK